ncbi:MAG: D-TA family PLP-dependent enzyme [Planctomycetota bacterium]
MTTSNTHREHWFRVDNLDEIATPSLLINPKIVEANLDRMVESVGGITSRLRPHVKTHKMRRIIEMKLSRGIQKFKTSTIAETELVLASGGLDVLLAMQPVGPDTQRLCHLAEQYGDAVVTALVDDAEVIDDIHAQAMEHDLRIGIYIDLNVGMNRTGIRPGDRAIALANRISQRSHVFLAGLHAYDGHLIGKDSVQLSKQNSEAFEAVWDLKKNLEEQGIAVENVVGGGTPTSPMLAERNQRIEVSAGTTVLWDAGQGSRMPDCDFEPAVVIATRVRSRPTQDQICLDLGHKAVAAEMSLPRCHLLDLPDARQVSQSEEHLVVESREAERLSVGECLFAVPMHICPTMALHQGAWCVEDGSATEFWTIDARDRKITV